MADNKTGDELYLDKQQGAVNSRLNSRKTVSGDTAQGAVATGAMQDASKIGAQKTGRGMLPGESVAQWKARLAKAQEEALTK